MIGSVAPKQGIYPQKAEVLLHFVFQEKPFEDSLLKKLDQKSGGKISLKLKKSEFKGKENETVGFENVGNYSAVYICGLGAKKEFDLTKFRNILAQLVRKISATKAKSADIFYFQDLGKDQFEIGRNVSIGFHLGAYQFVKYKGDEAKKKRVPLSELNLYLPSGGSHSEVKKGIEYGAVLAEGVSLTRDLVNEPASHLDPDDMVRYAQTIARESKGKVKIEILNETQCRKLGMGSFLGVAQGSDRPAKFIVLRYSGKPGGKKIALIGKTIIFDSGGLSLKPSEAMEDMKIDMAGGATVLGVFHVLAKTGGVKAQVFGILPACENMPSGKALRPGDIVHAMNKKTIEVLNTDAEGRLALADSLVYAEKRLKADYLIDLATLTGACMVALGTDLTGLFANDEAFGGKFETAAKKEGDEYWPLPLYKDYLKLMKSDIADLKNVNHGRYGGAITAAMFLSEFVDRAKWIHLDIAGPAFRKDEPKGVVDKGGTGWGVLSLVELLKTL